MICLGIRTKLFLVVAVCALTLAGFAWFMRDAAFAKRAWTILAVLAGIVVANVVVTLVIATSISRPLAALARRMGMLASGEAHTEIAERGRTDEIEAMAQASTIGHVSVLFWCRSGRRERGCPSDDTAMVA